VDDRRARILLIALGLLFVAIVLAAVALNEGGDAEPLPEAVERVSPRPGDAVIPQSEIVVDMQAGYDLQIVVDGLILSGDEVEVSTATGVHRWAPSDDNTITEWVPGTHTVVIRWDKVSGLPDRGSYSWSFRVQ